MAGPQRETGSAPWYPPALKTPGCLDPVTQQAADSDVVSCCCALTSPSESPAPQPTPGREGSCFLMCLEKEG